MSEQTDAPGEERKRIFPNMKDSGFNPKENKLDLPCGVNIDNGLIFTEKNTD